METLSQQWKEEVVSLQSIGAIPQGSTIVRATMSQAKRWRHQLTELTDQKTEWSRDLLRECMRRHLDASGYQLPIGGFRYQGAVMDLLAMHNERVVELAVKTDIAQFKSEFRAVYRIGKLTTNKHAAMERGKALPAFFFFVVPEGLLQVADIPPHCGLITAAVPRGKVLPVFTIVKAARVLHNQRIPAATYKHIAGKLYENLKQLRARYQKSPLDIFDSNRDRDNLTFL